MGAGFPAFVGGAGEAYFFGGDRGVEAVIR
jgi:hypothetical protein